GRLTPKPWPGPPSQGWKAVLETHSREDCGLNTAAPSAVLVRDEIVVGGKRQEIGEFVVQAELSKHPRCFLVLAGTVLLLAEELTHLGEFLRKQRLKQLARDLAAVIQSPERTSDPVPDLGSRDLGGGSILHQVEDRHATGARQPGAKVLDPNVDVDAQTVLGDGLLRLEIE